MPDKAWKKLRRPARYAVKTTPRRKRGKVKERIVRKRKYENQKLESEYVAEMEYRPAACRKTYRLIIVRKDLVRRDGQGELFPDYRYFFYITNDRAATPKQIVFHANDRCNQENLNAQLKGGVCALTTPVHTLLSNWAYMVMTSLAWNLKAWLALWNVPPARSTERTTQHTQQQRVLRMEFKTFVNYLMRLPAIVTHTGRRVMVRFISWSPLQPVLFRVLESFRPQRC
jgi:hypothetical protein